MNTIKITFLRLLRRKSLQSLWGQLQRFSIIGQNYWSSTVSESGELDVLDIVAAELKDKDRVLVIDVGANIGQFATAAFQRFHSATIHSFEPSIKTFGLLLENISSANMQERVNAHNYALSDSESSATLYSSHVGSSIASLYNLHNPIEKFSDEFSETVNTRTLDGFCKNMEISEIDYLKIDVEGHELSVLRGAMVLLSAGAIRYIQFEFGEANIDSRTYMRDFFELLSANYDLYRIVSNGIYLIPQYHPSIEVFATINYLAVRKNSV